MGMIHLVRHGQASFGSDDYDRLSPRGERQANLLGAWLADSGQVVDGMVVGAQRRHRQSAEGVVAGLGAAHAPSSACVCDKAFDEFDHAEVLCRHRPEFAANGALARFLAGRPDPQRAFAPVFEQAVERWRSGRHDADYRETWAAFRERCVGALHGVIGRMAADGSRNVVVFTSGGPIGAICEHLLGLSGARALDLHWALLNAGVTTLHVRGDRVRLQTFNCVAHLQVARDPDLMTYR